MLAFLSSVQLGDSLDLHNSNSDFIISCKYLIYCESISFSFFKNYTRFSAFISIAMSADGLEQFLNIISFSFCLYTVFTSYLSIVIMACIGAPIIQDFFVHFKLCLKC